MDPSGNSSGMDLHNGNKGVAHKIQRPDHDVSGSQIKRQRSNKLVDDAGLNGSEKSVPE